MLCKAPRQGPSPRTIASGASSVQPASGQGACCELAAEGTAPGWATALPCHPAPAPPSPPTAALLHPAPSGRLLLPRAAREPPGPAVSPGKPWGPFRTDPQGPSRGSQPALRAALVRWVEGRLQSQKTGLPVPVTRGTGRSELAQNNPAGKQQSPRPQTPTAHPKPPASACPRPGPPTLLRTLSVRHLVLMAPFSPQVLSEHGYGLITTDIREGQPFYYAEDYHQQYLSKNPDGYCGLGGTGVS